MQFKRFGFFNCIGVALLVATGNRLAQTAAPQRGLALRQPDVWRQHGAAAREDEHRFWGWTKAGQAAAVEIDGKTATGVAGPDGRWLAELKASAPGGPYTVKIPGSDQSAILREVLVGDVWLCGGQFNMEPGLGRTGRSPNFHGPDRNALRPGGDH